MSEVSRKPLGDVVTFQRGYDITKKEQTPGPYPVISSGGVASSHAEFRDEGPGVVIGRKGSLGGVYWSEGPYWPHDTTLWVRDFKSNDPRYVYYFLQTLGLERFDAGASNPTLNRNHLHLLDVAVLPRKSQTVVADVLSTFDRRIENNRRRIEILEKMARLIYREWFVHFRFPGHEHVELVDSDRGPIPEGWTLGAIDDLGDVVTGSTPPTKETSLYGGLAPFLTPSDMTGERFVETARSLSEQGIERFGRRMVPPGSVCFTCIGSIGKLAAVADPLLTNQQINSVVPLSPYSSGFIYQLLQDRSKYILSIASGAATPIVNKSMFKTVEVLLPHPDVLASFDRVECAMGELVRALTHQNRVLAEARDLLLPRLISGELDVSDLDLDLEPVA